MGDWASSVAIFIFSLLWVQIFMDYRRKLMRVLPGVREVSSRKTEFNSRISTSETNAQDILTSLANMRMELENLEQKRRELQDQLNGLDMQHIPAGRFRMGSNLVGREDEHPEHLVRLKEFYIDKYEVPNLQYKDFIDATGHREPVHWHNRTFPNPRQADHPVVNVSWEDARAYAEWVGKRLPTEAEWERVARGNRNEEYPWGKASSTDYANYDNPEGGTTPVARYERGRSDLGVWDLCGNVGEWVNDWYDPRYYATSPEQDPPGPAEGRQKVYRGGGYHTNKMDIRAAARHFATPGAYQDYIGFRCAMDAE